MPYQMWINGKHASGTSGSIIEVRNPATEEIIDTAPAANAADVDLAVSAAQAAFSFSRLGHKMWSYRSLLSYYFLPRKP